MTRTRNYTKDPIYILKNDAEEGNSYAYLELARRARVKKEDNKLLNPTLAKEALKEAQKYYLEALTIGLYQGTIDAQYILALLFKEEAEEIEKTDPVQSALIRRTAEFWLLKAELGGHARASYQRGLLLKKEIEKKKAISSSEALKDPGLFKIFEHAGILGDQDAQFLVGTTLKTEAEKQKTTHIQEAIGKMIFAGNYIGRAAEPGSFTAEEQELALLKGHPDMHFFKASKGHPDAQYILGMMIVEDAMRPEKKDEKEKLLESALYYLERAAKAKHKEAFYEYLKIAPKKPHNPHKDSLIRFLHFCIAHNIPSLDVDGKVKLDVNGNVCYRFSEEFIGMISKTEGWCSGKSATKALSAFIDKNKPETKEIKTEVTLRDNLSQYDKAIQCLRAWNGKDKLSAEDQSLVLTYCYLFSNYQNISKSQIFTTTVRATDLHHYVFFPNEDEPAFVEENIYLLSVQKKEFGKKLDLIRRTNRIMMIYSVTHAVSIFENLLFLHNTSEEIEYKSSEDMAHAIYKEMNFASDKPCTLAIQCFVRRFEESKEQTINPELEAQIYEGSAFSIDTETKKTTLHLASYNRMVNQVKYFMKGLKPEQIDQKDIEGYTAFHYAASYKNLGLLTLLAEQKADMEILSDNNGYTALQIVVINGDLLTATHLISLGAKLDTPDSNGYTALHLAVINSDLSMVKLLLSKGANAAILDKSRYNALHHAVKLGNLEITTHLCTVNKTLLSMYTCEGYNALQIAALSGNFLLVKQLVEMGANPNSKTGFGSSHPIILELFFSKNYEGVIKLSQLGADPNVAHLGETLLHQAYTLKQYSFIEEFIKCGANPNLGNTFGMTLLHNSVWSGDLAFTKKLLTLGAKSNVKNNLGLTPLDIAKQKGNFDLIHLLQLQCEEKTPIMLAPSSKFFPPEEEKTTSSKPRPLFSRRKQAITRHQKIS